MNEAQPIFPSALPVIVELREDVMLDSLAKQLQIAHHELGYRPVLLGRREGIIIIALPITPVPESSLSTRLLSSEAYTTELISQSAGESGGVLTASLAGPGG